MHRNISNRTCQLCLIDLLFRARSLNSSQRCLKVTFGNFCGNSTYFFTVLSKAQKFPNSLMHLHWDKVRIEVARLRYNNIQRHKLNNPFRILLMMPCDKSQLDKEKNRS